MNDALGARIGEYLLESDVAARSTEVAFRASHRVLPRAARVAILKPAFVGVRLAEIQLMREACILEALHHSGVPRVFECGEVERRPWIAAELVEGESIEHATAEGPLAISEAIAILRDAAAVLAHAHARGVVHRNLTPRAILRTPARSFPLCITDWGDASLHDQAIPHVVDHNFRFYRAPELSVESSGDAPVDGRADVFALGAVMYEAATLVLPDPVQKFPGMPVAFHRLLASMLQRFADDRPTAAAVHAEAARLAETFSEGEGAIEEVEVELVDISRASPPMMAGLGWIPPGAALTPPPPGLGAPGRRQAVGTARRRKVP
ncbi:MAG TPA: protein kinase [Kofleriaceae bacterium]|nr:protein kinase [Kofleriaceae bacterium]